MTSEYEEFAVQPMEQPGDIADVFYLLGMLHQEQAELFAKRRIEITLPGFDLEDFNIDVIRVYEDSRMKVAGIIVTKQSGCFKDTYTVADIILYPKYRNKGLGTRAMELVFKMMAADGVKFVNLNVHADNEAAIHLYEKLGFEPTSIHMTKRLA